MQRQWPSKAKTKPNQKPKLCRRLRLLPSLLSRFQGTTIRRKLKKEVSLLYLLSLLFLLVLELSLLSTHLAMGSSRTSFCDNAAFASKLPIGGRASVSMSGAE